MPEILHIDSLELQLSGRSILKDISLRIDAGSFVGILGPNGSGKTSLLNCISRQYPLAKGSIQLLGRPLSDYSQRQLAQSLAYLDQQMPAEVHLKVRDIVELGLLPHLQLLERLQPEHQALVDNTLAEAGLVSIASRPFSKLSGGEQQRVMIARMLVQQSPLVLLDEPTNHLDIHYQNDIMQLIHGLDRTVIACLHDLNLAASFCDQIILLDQGSIVAYGSPQTVLDDQTIQQVYGIPAVVDNNPLTGHPRISFSVGAKP